MQKLIEKDDPYLSDDHVTRIRFTVSFQALICREFTDEELGRLYWISPTRHICRRPVKTN